MPAGAGIAVDVADEHVVVAVDAREACELGVGQPRLRAAEPPLARAGAEALEERGDRRGVAVPKRPDREAVDVARLHGAIVARMARGSPRRRGPSC